MKLKRVLAGTLTAASIAYLHNVATHSEKKSMEQDEQWLCGLSIADISYQDGKLSGVRFHDRGNAISAFVVHSPYYDRRETVDQAVVDSVYKGVAQSCTPYSR